MAAHPSLREERFRALSPDDDTFDDVLDRALREDVGSGDITTLALVAQGHSVKARICARTTGTVAGIGLTARVFRLLDRTTRVIAHATDGATVKAGDAIAELEGDARSMLVGERVALNFLGLLSGIATTTARYVDAVRGLGVRIASTRKTTPTLRALERYAVRAGGGYNHRAGLWDAVLIKDNHIAALGSIKAAVAAARSRVPAGTILEVECDKAADVGEALVAGVDAILLDNMELPQLRDCVALARDRAVIEASGGVTLENVRAIASSGVDIISVGAITHGAPWLDIGMDL